MEKILVLDFGGQYDQLIARRVRDLGVYAQIRRYNKVTTEQIEEEGYKGIIFTGGPNSVYEKDSPSFDKRIFGLKIPVLGICYGAQLMAHLCGGKVISAEDSSEYGSTRVYVKEELLFKGVKNESVCWMSHTDYISQVPAGFEILARSDKCPCAAMGDPSRKLYAVQFHPEVTHTECGRQIFSNFLFDICGCKGDWRMDDFVSSSIEKYRKELKGKKVLLALSGGVDSSVAAVLLHKAIGNDLTCVFVDHGLLRKGEAQQVEELFKNRFGLHLIRVDAKERFLKKLKGVKEPEVKRKIIGEEFVRVFEEEAKKIGDVDVLVQGTIYPDVIESGKGDSATIKSHHNVGGLPEDMSFKTVCEPLRDLFKDEVRKAGIQLGIPEKMVFRQPFPGPGLAVRILGGITKEKLDILKEADAVFTSELEAAGLEEKASQYFAVLTDSRAVGVKGDARSYGYTVALRAVTTDDFMTAKITRIPYELLERIATRICNEVKDVSCVVYDITSKPPGTIEWE
ncbi:MAG: glutamine-hydrolyzing GMP synthase [Erysipelotrichaceae bacterium]|nr:glutamine-hydrolyzing GMP synthase [Erysipelotrichaceae bacterium]